MSSIGTLRVLSPPSFGSDVRPQKNWSRIEHALGTPLPDDYKALVDEYGPVGVDNYLWTLVPDAQLPEGDIVALAGHNRQFVAMRPIAASNGFGPFPGPHGLLGWAVTEGGSLVAWDTGSDVNDWQVVLLDRDGIDLERFMGGAVDFLIAVLTGRRFDSIFPDDFPAKPVLTWRQGE